MVANQRALTRQKFICAQNIFVEQAIAQVGCEQNFLNLGWIIVRKSFGFKRKDLVVSIDQAHFAKVSAH